MSDKLKNIRKQFAFSKSTIDKAEALIDKLPGIETMTALVVYLIEKESK